MSSESGHLGETAIAVAYALVYAVAVAVVATVGLGVVTLVAGGGLVRLKFLLFLAGWLLMAYATFQLWPSSPEDLHNKRTLYDETDPSGDAQSRFRETVYSLPPARWLPTPPPERQLTDATKLFLGSLLVLLSSFLLETILGAG